MNFTEIKPGLTVEKQEIQAYKTIDNSSRYIYLMAGVHGDEVEGVYVLEQLFEWLKQTDDVIYPLVVIPMLNVDGHFHRQRTNSHGVDLNRNLPTTTWDATVAEKKFNPGSGPLSEPENQYLIQLFKKYPPSFIFTFHSWKPVLNYNGDAISQAQFIARFNQYPIADDIGYPTPGSLGTLGPEKYNAPVLTYECPTITDSGKTLKEIWEENETGLKELLLADILPKS